MTNAELEHEKDRLKIHFELIAVRLVKKFNDNQRSAILKNNPRTCALGIISPNIFWDLTGKACGMYCTNHKTKGDHIRLHLEFAKRESDYDCVIAHELAHYIVHKCFGNSPKPHGKEWKQVMAILEYDPEVTHSYDTSFISSNARKYMYKCKCNSFHFGLVRHRRAVRAKLDKRRGYTCTKCKTVCTRVGE